jgi:hypothetical protein
MAETMAIDLDGTVIPFALYNPKIKFPWYFFLFYAPIVLLTRPIKTMVEYLRNFIEQGGKVIITTARPVQVAELTRFLLKLHRVPFTELICVGNGRESNNRKLDVARIKKVALFVDNDRKAVDFFRENSVVAVNVAELLTPSE